MMTCFFVVLLVLQITQSIWFHKRQNTKGWTGGPISWPKAFWLWHAIFSWYLVPLVWVFFPDLDSRLRTVLILHLVSWWIRGPIELLMIYKYFNWTPLYGITHDLVHILILVIGLIWALPQWNSGASVTDLFVEVFVVITIIMTMFEISFAYLFLKVRGQKDHKIYYASDEPQWRFINRLTIIAVTLGLLHLVMQAAGVLLLL
jgi:hypothetical protein